MNDNAWWVARTIAVITVFSAPGAWAIMWIFDPSPNLTVVFGWAVSIGMLGAWVDAAAINATGRRVDEESRVLRPGHRNGRPQ